MTLSSYFAAVRAVAEDIAKIPLPLYRETSDGGRERAKSHPVYSLLHDAPNPDMGSMDFRATMTANACNWGSGYAEIVRAGGMPVELWPLESDKMSAERDPEGNLFYIYRKDGQETRLLQHNVFHLRGLASDGINGYSIVRLARESLGQGMAEQRSGAAYFGNSSIPFGVIETEADVDEAMVDQFRKDWDAKHRGSENAYRPAFLFGGASFKPLTISNQDAQFIESRQFTVEDMARWLRVPPHVIGHLLRSTNNNIEHQGIEYVTLCLLSWAVRWEQEIKRKLISPRNKNIYAEHMFDALLRGDSKSRNDAYQKAIQSGWLSINDVRRKENENPIGPAGDIHMVQVNMQNVEQLRKLESADDTDGGNQNPGREPDQAQSEGKEGTQDDNGVARTAIALGTRHSHWRDRDGSTRGCNGD